MECIFNILTIQIVKKLYQKDTYYILTINQTFYKFKKI